MYAIDATRLNWPTDWDQLFGRSAPKGLEIGFGNGEFLIDLAQRQPEVDFIAIEISLPSIRKAEKKAKRLGLGNIQLIHGDARLALWCGCREETFAAVYINFPDPWHKAAHHHRKLINPRFLHLLATRMLPAGRLDIATDDPGYQEVIYETLEGTPYFQSRTGQTATTEDLERFRTKYELKALAEGRVPHYYHWARNETAAPDHFSIPEVYEMPHVILETTLTLEQISERYSIQAFSGSTPVRLLQMFQTAGPIGGSDAPDAESEGRKTALLVETHIAEDPMPQRVGLTIQPRPDQTVILGLHELGFPRPTNGVHIAVAHLAGWLLRTDPAARVRHHNLRVPVER